jgi:hypothetical protein
VRRLAAESLEHRLLLAGNVTASVSGGSLTIRGDALGNGIAVTQLDADSYVVSGFATDGTADGATRVNGQTTSQVFNNVRYDINIDLGAGDDTLTLENDAATNEAFAEFATGQLVVVVPTTGTARDFATTNPDRIDVQRNLIVRLGDGNDFALLDFDVGIRSGGSITLDSGTGNDNVYVDTALSRRNATFRTGAGNDLLAIANLDVRGSFMAIMEDGVDTFDAFNLLTESTLINTGGGDNEVFIEDSRSTQETVILTSDGDDRVEFDGYQASLLQINTFGDDDNILLNNVTTTGNLNVSTAGGNDTLIIGQTAGNTATVDVGQDANINTGDGNDTVTASNVLVRVYGLTKSALVQFTKVAAVEWARDNVQVNCIIPGFYRTPLTEAGLWQNEERSRWLLERIPAGRAGEPEELVGAALLLASPASDYMTGSSVTVDGGFLAGGWWDHTV